MNILRLLLFKLHKETTKQCLNIMEAKNADYGGEWDPYANFRAEGVAGFVTRMGDKMSRIRTWARRGYFMVSDEGIEDTIKDLINYCVLLLGFIKYGGLTPVGRPILESDELFIDINTGVVYKQHYNVEKGITWLMPVNDMFLDPSLDFDQARYTSESLDKYTVYEEKTEGSEF